MFTILDCLEDTAKRFPDQVICEDETETVTFQQFVIRAKAVGTYLSRYRASGKPVAVFMDNTAAAWRTSYIRPRMTRCCKASEAS